MDFTLLNSQRKLSEFSKNSINDFAKHKIGFTIASARSFTTLKPLLNGVSFLLPIVEFNGGYLTNFRTEKPIKIVDLPKKVSKGLFQLSVETKYPEKPKSVTSSVFVIKGSYKQLNLCRDVKSLTIHSQLFKECKVDYLWSTTKQL
ncbi:MAG: HAD family hydrolase [Candidatus Hodarchaeales archaeon]|jgi:hydroxymethylpyrimidine pyrophosphatase-like HAD family hydrolase